MTVSVVVPWRGGCEHRRRALMYVSRWWNELGFPLDFGHCESRDWCKAAAVADALEGDTAEVVVVADADVVLVDADDLRRAVDALGTHGWAVPHRSVLRWSQEQTAQILAGVAPSSRPAQRHSGFLGGGITVLTRALYDAVPMDPRFVGWGQEDESWAHALTRLAGVPWRGSSDMWHLWHPPQERMSRRWGSPESKVLARRYERASVREMRRLVDEAKAVTV